MAATRWGNIGRKLTLEDPSIADPRVRSEIEELVLYQNSLPLINLRAVASSFYEDVQGYIPVDDGSYELYPMENGPFTEDRFLVRAEGNSMEPDIPDGSICRFRLDPGGSRNGKIVLCVIPDSAGGPPIAVIKRYHSVRNSTGTAQQIVLTSINSEHPPIVLSEDIQPRIIGIYECGLIQNENP